MQLLIELGHRQPVSELERVHFAAVAPDHQAVIDEIEVDGEGDTGLCVQATRRQTTDVYVERNVPPVVAGSGRGHPHLADNLNSQVQSGLRFLPLTQRKFLGARFGCRLGCSWLGICREILDRCSAWLHAERNLVDEAPTPVLAGLGRADDWVVGVARVPARVPIGRRVAAADQPARHAHAQVHPRAPYAEALLAACDRLGESKDRNLIEVATAGHRGDFSRPYSNSPWLRNEVDSRVRGPDPCALASGRERAARRARGRGYSAKSSSSTLSSSLRSRRSQPSCRMIRRGAGSGTGS